MLIEEMQSGYEQKQRGEQIRLARKDYKLQEVGPSRWPTGNERVDERGSRILEGASEQASEAAAGG